MDIATASHVLECLSSKTRLQIFRLLIREGAIGMVAGQIASQLEIAPTNASFHLKAMTHAELLSVQQEGRFQRYRANMALMLDLVAYLTEECCSGHPELCASPVAVKVPIPKLRQSSIRSVRTKR